MYSTYIYEDDVNCQEQRKLCQDEISYVKDIN